MNRTLPLAIVVLIGLLFLPFNIASAASDSQTAININQDGTITPSSAPLQLVENTYFLRENTSMPIIIQRDNTVFDGNGYSLNGEGNGTAINLVCSNSTIKNAGVVNWGTGILSTRSNNTITQNILVANYYGVAIYAERNFITANQIVDNREGIHIEGSSNLIYQNQLRNNSFGIMDPNNVIKNSLVENNLQDNSVAICTSNAILQTYRNNFIGNTYNIQIVQTTNPWDSDLTRFWDDGSQGNYWSNHTIQTEYLVHASYPQIIDRYPLTNPVNIAQVTLPLPKTLPNPSTSPTSSPTPTTPQETPTPKEQQTLDSITLEVGFAIALMALGVAAFLLSREHKPNATELSPSS